jgi:hypothetical protein
MAVIFLSFTPLVFDRRLPLEDALYALTLSGFNLDHRSARAICLALYRA